VTSHSSRTRSSRAGPAESIRLEDLPRHTRWPAALLTTETPKTYPKTHRQVMREFNDEKWATLLRRFSRRARATRLEIEDAFNPLNEPMVIFEAGRFRVVPYRRSLENHLARYERVLAPHASGASALVELGAGFGSKLFGLAERRPFAALPLVAAELTENGRRLILRSGKLLGRKVSVGACDFRRLEIDRGLVPPGALVFTSYALHYVPRLPARTLDYLIALRPQTVVHFEPLFEIFAADSLHDLLCRRYMQLNDYTRNLLSLIRAAERAGRIEVLEISKNVIGDNPLLPISVIKWRPQ
jgi:hypothetical protein